LRNRVTVNMINNGEEICRERWLGFSEGLHKCRDFGLLPRNVCIAWRHGFYY